MAVVHALPRINRLVLCYLIRFLQVGGGTPPPRTAPSMPRPLRARLGPTRRSPAGVRAACQCGHHQDGRQQPGQGDGAQLPVLPLR